MAGWQLPSTVQPGVEQPAESFPCGDAKTWSINVPGKDLTGYSAEWMLGIPPDATKLGLFPRDFQPPKIAVLKTSGTDLNILSIQGGSQLLFDLNFADTVQQAPGTLWSQAVVVDPMGRPTTVAEGKVQLTPSLRAFRYCSPEPVPLWAIPPTNFGIWQGTNAPAKTWSFGNPPNLPDFTGSVFELDIQGLAGSALSLLTGDGTGAFTLDLPTATVTWNYTTAQSAAMPTSGAAYQIFRHIGGAVELWAHGQIVGLAP